MSVVKDVLALFRPAARVIVRDSSGIVPPYRMPGYKEPERMRAVDYVEPKARFPLVWVTDINNWSREKTTNQVSFNLTHAVAYTGESARFDAKMPYHEGKLFDKEGAYIVAVIPAKDEELVRAILEAAGYQP